SLRGPDQARDSPQDRRHDPRTGGPDNHRLSRPQRLPDRRVSLSQPFSRAPATGCPPTLEGEHHVIKPHGSDTLNPLFVYDSEKHHALIKEAESLPSLLLNSAAAANAVMLGAGYFNPLTGYMTKADALSVALDMNTTDGLFWPVPVVNLTRESGIQAGQRIALRDPNVEGNPVLAIMDVEAVETVSQDDIQLMASEIFGTLDPKHPGVAVFTNLGNTLLSGPIQVLNLSYFQTDFPDTFRTAVEIRNEIAERGWNKVVAFQTRNPMHRAHEELCRMALER